MRSLINYELNRMKNHLESGRIFLLSLNRTEDGTIFCVELMCCVRIFMK